MNIKKILRSLLNVFIVIGVSAISLACLGTLIYFISFEVSDYKREMAWRETLTPLSPETIEDLCAIFKLDPSDRRCKPNKKVYSYQYYGEAYLIFSRLPKMNNSLPTTFEDVEHLIGHYNQGCTDMGENGETWFSVCYYDFSEMDEDPFALAFDDSGILFNFHSRHID